MWSSTDGDYLSVPNLERPHMSMAVLRVDDIVHPADRATRQRLEAIPVLQAAVKAYLNSLSNLDMLRPRIC